MSKYTIVAKTLHNLEGILLQELEGLGAEHCKIQKRAVSFTGDDELLYLSHIKTRTALSFLVPIYEFKAHDEEDLYSGIYEINWEEMFSIDQTFAVDATISGTVFRHSKYVALKTKDAIVDRFRRLQGQRPSIDTKNPELKINIHIQHKDVTVSLDATGKPLDKRGYRKETTEAPLSETLAAGILLKANILNSKNSIYDPMTGSGTFAIEAALILTNTYPNLNRKFCFQNWPDYDYTLFEKIKSNLLNEKRSILTPILASDINPQNVDVAKKNATVAGVSEYIQWKDEDFFASNAQNISGTVFINPPYDIRLKVDHINDFYKKIGDQLKKNYPDHDAWIISSNTTALKKLGLKPSFKTELYNGGTLCKLHKYELYKGTRT